MEIMKIPLEFGGIDFIYILYILSFYIFYDFLTLYLFQLTPFFHQMSPIGILVLYVQKIHQEIMLTLTCASILNVADSRTSKLSCVQKIQFLTQNFKFVCLSQRDLVTVNVSIHEVGKYMKSLFNEKIGGHEEN